MTFKDALLHGMTIRESANDGSDFTNPAADYRRLFLGEDGQLHVRDSAGTVTDIGGNVADILDLPTVETDTDLRLAPDGAGGVEWAATGGGGNPLVYQRTRYTAGDITVSSTSAGADMSGIGDLTVAAASGDLVMIGLAGRHLTNNSSSIRFDFKMVAGATQNYVSSETTTPSPLGLVSFFGTASGTWQVCNEIPYVLVADDVSGGNCTVSVRAWLSGAQNWVINADSDDPLIFWVRNLGQ